jgi:hypothetical protein
VVLAAVRTENESDAVTTRVRKVDSLGFDVGMDEQEQNRQQHLGEDIDYIAWEASSGQIDGFRFEVGATPDAVSDRPYTLVYAEPGGSVPFFLASMQTTDGGDTADVRWMNRDADAADVWIDEEQSKDSETSHTKEVVGYVLLWPL